MTRYLLSNLDVEYQWACHPQHYTPGRHALAMRTRWTHLLRLAPGLLDASPWAQGPRPDNLTTWGIDQGDMLEITRDVNDKRFSHHLTVTLGCTLPGASIFTNLTDLQTHIQASTEDWVLKHPMGVSGRERVLGRAGTLETPALRWAEKQFKKGWGLLWEPWAQVCREWSVHADLEDDGVHWCGATEILTDSGGTPRGHIVNPETSLVATQEQQAALQAVWERGYRGPASIDAWESDTQTRPISEINARWTFGRMAWELRRWVPNKWMYAWCHPPRSAPFDVRELPELRTDVEVGWYTMPTQVDPGAHSGTAIACAPDRRALETLLQRPPTTDSSSA